MCHTNNLAAMKTWFIVSTFYKDEQLVSFYYNIIALGITFTTLAMRCKILKPLWQEQLARNCRIA